MRSNIDSVVRMNEIKKLKKQIETCGKCGLSRTRTNSLCGEGKYNARLFLVAQAPGENENRKGRMFVGPSGDVLNELLEAGQIGRDQICRQISRG